MVYKINDIILINVQHIVDKLNGCYLESDFNNEWPANFSFLFFSKALCLPLLGPTLGCKENNVLVACDTHSNNVIVLWYWGAIYWYVSLYLFKTQ